MITMLDIARRTGVSRTAVSAVLNGGSLKGVRISAEKRQQILDAAEALGYRPNQLARAVALGKTRMLGYLVDEPRYEPYWNIMVGALAAAEELGFTLKLLPVNCRTLAERVRQCTELRLGGLIARVNGDKSPIFQEANSARIPVVTVDEGVPQPSGTRVTSDDSAGIAGILEHLTQLGHRRIAFISSGFPAFGFMSGDVGTERERLFREQMDARGLGLLESCVARDTVLVFGRPAEYMIDDSSARAATKRLLSHPAGRPTAIVCWRDETALFAIRECHRQGLSVPGDISVVGFSDISAARLFDPPLTTVKMPWEEIGRIAIQRLAEQVNENYDPSPATYLVPTTLVVRASTGPAPHTQVGAVETAQSKDQTTHTRRKDIR